MAEGLALLACGATCTVAAVMHWRGLVWTDEHPDSWGARTYLIWLPGGVAWVLAGLLLMLEMSLPALLRHIVAWIVVVLMASVLVMVLWAPERVRPGWQKRQKQWLAANRVDGRDPPWETRPEEWKHQGWFANSSWRLWRLDRDRSSGGSERDHR